MKRLLIIAVFGIAASTLALGQRKQPTAEDGDDVERQLRQMLSEWDEAYFRRDTETLSRILADDFSFIHASGVLINKVQYIMACVKAPDIALDAPSRSDDIKVRIYGDTAVVTSRSTQKGQPLNRDLTTRYRYTDVWVRQQQRWQAVASQATPILHP